VRVWDEPHSAGGTWQDFKTSSLGMARFLALWRPCGLRWAVVVGVVTAIVTPAAGASSRTSLRPWPSLSLRRLPLMGHGSVLLAVVAPLAAVARRHALGAVVATRYGVLDTPVSSDPCRAAEGPPLDPLLALCGADSSLTSHPSLTARGTRYTFGEKVMTAVLSRGLRLGIWACWRRPLMTKSWRAGGMGVDVAGLTAMAPAALPQAMT